MYIIVFIKTIQQINHYETKSTFFIYLLTKIHFINNKTSHLNTFIIHYTKLSERKAVTDKLFKDKYFKLEYITKYDQEDLVTINLDDFYLDDKSMYLKKSKLWSQDNAYRRLNDAEISCTLKHFEAIKKSSESSQEVSLIIEDDVLTFSKFFISKIKKVLSLDSEWDLLFIGQGISKNFILKNINKKGRLRSKLYDVQHPATNCAESYFIKKDAAKKIFESMLPFNMISDWELAFQIYDLNLKVKWLYPPIFYQGSKSGKYKSELR